jgi:hypothetical protein
VYQAAESFPGTNRSFGSGPLAHGTANCPIHQRDKGLNGDCGVVLDRRSHPTLGPDSPQHEGPHAVVRLRLANPKGAALGEDRGLTPLAVDGAVDPAPRP